MIYLLPILAGLTVTLSVVQNGRLARKTSLKNTTLLNFITGLSGMLIIFLLTKQSFSAFNKINELPLLAFIGGICGVIVVMLTSYIVNQIPVISATMLIYVGQLFAGFIIDYFRGIDLSLLKLIGFALIISGIYLVNRVDFIEKKTLR